MMIDELDKDGSGDIDMNEFITGVSVSNFSPKLQLFGSSLTACVFDRKRCQAMVTIM